MPIWYDPITTIGKNAFITEIIEAAGGRSVTDDLPAEWPQISMEVVLERAPDALLLVRGGKTTLKVLQDRPGWSSMAAIQDAPRLLRGRPDQFRQSGSDRCTGGSRKTISSLS